MARLLIVLFALAIHSVAFAAIVVTTDDNGQVSRSYFGDGAFVLMEGSRPTFGVDAQGNCWFVEQGRLISDPCETMFSSMQDIQKQMMAGMSQDDLQAMKDFRAAGAGAPKATLTPADSRIVAGYEAICVLINELHEVCTSNKLLNDILDEMGSSKFLTLIKQMSNSVRNMGMPNPEGDAVADLMEKGYPVWDKKTQMGGMPGMPGMPTMSPEMLQFLPPDQRDQLMKQFGGNDPNAPMVGREVVSVDRGDMPATDFSQLQQVSFRDFMQQQFSGMRPPR